jgi:hypothetical protein
MPPSVCSATWVGGMGIMYKAEHALILTLREYPFDKVSEVSGHGVGATAARPLP